HAGVRCSLRALRQCKTYTPAAWQDAHVYKRPLPIARDGSVVRRLQRDDQIRLAGRGGVLIGVMLPSNVRDATIERVAWRPRVLLEPASQVLRHTDVQEDVPAIEEEVDAAGVRCRVRGVCET